MLSLARWLQPLFPELGELGIVRSCSNVKAKSVMGINFRPMSACVTDMALSLMALGVIEKRGTPQSVIAGMKTYPEESEIRRVNTTFDIRKTTSMHPYFNSSDKITDHQGDGGPPLVTPTRTPTDCSPSNRPTTSGTDGADAGDEVCEAPI
eukprot:GHVN01079331.1.p1 GENE.GHVN01079331.1~~GHVN01079331.1.p1  ORF type:complete len:151 (-),score=25.69 GHVN01079331.1:637-1089(-)